MGYGALASAINNKKENITGPMQSIQSISFESVWSGPAYTKLTTDLKNTMDALNEQKSYIESFASALELLQTYKDNKTRQATLQNQLSSIENTAANSNTISSLVTQIDNCITTNQTIREKIQAIFAAIPSISSSLEAVSFTLLGGQDYITDVQELYKLFASGQLTKLPDSGKSSLYDYYTEEEVAQVLKEVQTNYTGRYAAVNSALALMQMAADKGLKLDYDWGGGHNYTVARNSDVATGADCSGFASWAINQGSTDTFNARTTSGLISVGERVDYSQAQQGDILVYNNGEAGHVVMIVENNPDEGTFLVAEAKGSDYGVILQERSYSSLQSSSYQARDLTSLYNN